MTEKLSSKPQLHVSMLNTLAGCGIKFKRRYGHRFGIWEKEEITPPSVALITGITVHKACEKNLRYMMEHDFKPAPWGEIREHIIQEFAGSWNKGVELMPEEEVNTEATYEKALNQTLALSNLHYESIAPKLRPINVEKKFVIELTDFPIDLAGTIDVIEHNCIRDTKTSKGIMKSARTTQMAMYCIAYKVEHGRYPDMVVLDVLRKLVTPKASTIIAIPDDVWIQPTLNRLLQALKVIVMAKEYPEVLVPARPDDWVCTEKFCPFFKTCEYAIPEEQKDIKMILPPRKEIE